MVEKEYSSTYGYEGQTDCHSGKQAFLLSAKTLRQNVSPGLTLKRVPLKSLSPQHPTPKTRGNA